MLFQMIQQRLLSKHQGRTEEPKKEGGGENDGGEYWENVLIW